MTYPVFNTSGLSNAVGSASGPVTCSACGCRLERAADRAAWVHFSPMGGRDARGCRVACVDAAHDASGRALSS
jgi:hypothetical protein